MTYHAGIGPRLAGGNGTAPHVTCDGCAAIAVGETKEGLPKAWLRKNTAPPGWKLVRTEEPFSRKDWCKACKKHMVPADLNLARITGLYTGAPPPGFDSEWYRLPGDMRNKYFVRAGWQLTRCPGEHSFDHGCPTCAPYHGAIAVKVGA